MKSGRQSPFCVVLLLSACSAAQDSRVNAPQANAPRTFRGDGAGSAQSVGAPFDTDSDGLALSQEFSSARSLKTLSGDASYYSDRLAGHATASGAPYRPEAYTAAHRKLPLGTVLRVTRQDDGRVVYVRVNDRGPFTKRRILDLSRAAAESLGMLQTGVVAVRAEVVAYGPGKR
ncbi:MAG TPA: septal ring lytic transglycosylase RlpA family protein [Polyangiaceae bacterium]